MVYALPQWLDHVQYVVVAADGKVRRTVDIPLPQTTMLHDMGLTERYAMVFDFPCRLDIEMAMNGSTFPLRWQPGTGCRVGLLPREGEANDIIWVDLPGVLLVPPDERVRRRRRQRRHRPVRLRPDVRRVPHRPVRGQPRPTRAVDDQPDHPPGEHRRDRLDAAGVPPPAAVR